MLKEQLIVFVKRTGSHFFDDSAMDFFGDTVRNYCVSDKPVMVKSGGEQVSCWELYRKHPVKHGLQTSAFFDAVTFDRVFPEGE